MFLLPTRIIRQEVQDSEFCTNFLFPGFLLGFHVTGFQCDVCSFIKHGVMQINRRFKMLGVRRSNDW